MKKLCGLLARIFGRRAELGSSENISDADAFQLAVTKPASLLTPVENRAIGRFTFRYYRQDDEALRYISEGNYRALIPGAIATYSAYVAMSDA